MSIWQWQEIVYFLLFIISVPLIPSWDGRFSLFLTAVFFTIARPLRLCLGYEGVDHLLFYIVYETVVTSVISLFLVNTKRLYYFLALQFMYVSYLIYEYCNWDNYTYTWDYYSYIQMFFLDLTLSVLIIDKKKILTIFHIFMYTAFTIILTLLSKESY